MALLLEAITVLMPCTHVLKRHPLPYSISVTASKQQAGGQSSIVTLIPLLALNLHRCCTSMYYHDTTAVPIVLHTRHCWSYHQRHQMAAHSAVPALRTCAESSTMFHT